MAKFKTKFDSIVKLKKLKIDEVNKDISKLNSQLNKINQELLQIEQEISEFEYPKNGNFSLITQFKMLLNAKILELNQKKENIKFLENQKKILLEKLKEVNFEYEKMKYLQGEEIKKEIKKIKQQEAKNLDEIALMLHKGNR